MRRWVETSWYRYRFEEKHSKKESKSQKFADGRWENNYWEPDDASVQAGLEKLQSYCDKNQYEIKSVMPLTRAQSHEYGFGYAGLQNGMGLGYGWGVSVEIGFVAVLQRVEEVSEEEYDRRMNARKQAVIDAMSEQQHQAEVIEVNSQFEISKRNFEELKTNYQKFEFLSTCPITTEKAIFGVKYVVCDKSFKTSELAEEYLKECKLKAAGLLPEIEIMRNKINDQAEKLSSLKKAKSFEFTISNK